MGEIDRYREQYAKQLRDDQARYACLLYTSRCV